MALTEVYDFFKRMEDEKDGEMAMKNYDDVESGAIYESVNRMKAIIGVN